MSWTAVPVGSTEIDKFLRGVELSPSEQESLQDVLGISGYLNIGDIGHYTVSDSGEFSTLISAANANASQSYYIHPTADISIAENITVPQNITLIGGKYKVADGYTMVVDGHVQNPGNIFMFADENGNPPPVGLYDGTFGYAEKAYPEWFGASGNGDVGGAGADDTKAIKACLDACSYQITMLTKTYRVTESIDINARRVHGRKVNGSTLIFDNTTGGLTPSGRAIKFGSDVTSFSNSYLTELEEMYIKMDDASGIDAIRCNGTIGEHSNLKRITIRAVKSSGNPVHSIYVDDYVQNLNMQDIWIVGAAGQNYDNTIGIRMPKGRGYCLRNATVTANIGIEADADGGIIEQLHIEGAASAFQPAIGVWVKSRGGVGDENPRTTLSINGLNSRDCSGALVYLDPSTDDAAVVIQNLSKIESLPGEDGENLYTILDSGVSPAISTTSGSVAFYSREGTNILTTNSDLGY